MVAIKQFNDLWTIMEMDFQMTEHCSPLQFLEFYFCFGAPMPGKFPETFEYIKTQSSEVTKVTKRQTKKCTKM